MKLGFIAEPYEETNASGMGYVVSELLRNLPLNKEDSLIVYSSKPASQKFIGRSFKNVLVPKSLFGKLIYFYCLKDDLDALLFVAPLLPLLIPKKIKAVLICQELASQKTPVSGLKERLLAFIRDHILMPRCLSRSRVVVAASFATKKDIHTFYKIADEKVRVVHDGYQDLSIYSNSAKEVDQKMKPFFFFAGKVKPRKNVHGIAKGFISFKKRAKSDAKLVIGGDYGGDYYKNIIKDLEENNLKQDVFFIGYTAGAKLYSFYKNALALVFPSFNEGFGMPPVEAMSLGTPVITSRISSMPEVAGDAAILVDPYDPEDIGRAMEKIYSDDSFRKDLILKGLDRAKVFSWPKAALLYMKILRSL